MGLNSPLGIRPSKGHIGRMATTTVTCEKCGAVYERSTTKVTFRDKDTAECTCGHTLESWNGSQIPSFRKIKEGSFDDPKHPGDFLP
jgi:hypothetical protein